MPLLKILQWFLISEQKKKNREECTKAYLSWSASLQPYRPPDTDVVNSYFPLGGFIMPHKIPLPTPSASAIASSSGTGAANLNAVRETMDVLLEISRISNTGLDMETLSICVRLCEQGTNPEALPSVIKKLHRATEALKTADND
ncbi:mitotic-spindle organizing protein 1-like [Ochotona curzoniae]|uniref:mitotic-spindle organizing protein 1-like n=1 Tax=Ochotona curzoniae TaxID=130825 RepID=UPI001B34DC93|nr:mitotic-spindle organizing protein 1-like [Ochotona curzoniae]